MKLSENLKDLRKKANLTQQQVSDAIGINRSAYAYYEVGKSRPKIESLEKLAAIYNITVDELIGDDKDVAQVDDPKLDTGWSTTDKFNDLSEFEQSVILKVRLMSKDEKNELVGFLSD